jgi:hypothetical protein
VTGTGDLTGPPAVPSVSNISSAFTVVCGSVALVRLNGDCDALSWNHPDLRSVTRRENRHAGPRGRPATRGSPGGIRTIACCQDWPYAGLDISAVAFGSSTCLPSPRPSFINAMMNLDKSGCVADDRAGDQRP